MILELDCGNSFIKWRVLSGAEVVLVAEGVVDSDLALCESLCKLSGLSLRSCRMVSVRTTPDRSA